LSDEAQHVAIRNSAFRIPQSPFRNPHSFRIPHSAFCIAVRLLIVGATETEILPLISAMQRTSDRGPRTTSYTHAGHDIVVLTTDVGMVATAAWCSSVMTNETFDLALNFGVCGSFDRRLEPGRVVHVVSDCLAELGAEDGDAFLSIDELQLPAEHEFMNANPPKIEALSQLPAVSAITVNTVHGSERSIAAVVARCAPQVESMEGAAFMLACQIHGLPFAQVRSVSNIVERRNRSGWKMMDAIASLNDVAIAIVEGA
jgi:futalosine hydrolase